MKKLGAIAIMLTGLASIVGGAACLLQHFVGGDLMAQDHLKECLALFAAGAATASPGLEVFKRGVFARPEGPAAVGGSDPGTDTNPQV